MPNWLHKLRGRSDDAPAASTTVQTAVAAPPRFEPAPEFSTRLEVDRPGAPGRAGAEALYRKWADKWQEF